MAVLYGNSMSAIGAIDTFELILNIVTRNHFSQWNSCRWRKMKKLAVGLFCLSGFLLVQGIPNPEERTEIESSLAAESADSAPEVISSQDEKIPGLIGSLGTKARVGCGTMNSLNPMPCYQFSTGCYCISQTAAAWRTAFDTCAAAGKQLISIDSLAKSIDLQNNLQLVVGINTNLATQGWWTSGVYSVPLSTFFWASTGASFTFTNWPLVSNPITLIGVNRDANGVCVHVAASDLTSQFWDEQSCTALFPFICQ